jgi:Mg/Co/Ni transporter MgtE
MSPRAACRLETLGFERVYGYVGGKADWLGHGLPREGKTAAIHYAGELADPDPPTCRLDTPLADITELLDGSRYGYCLVVTPGRVVLGRVRRSALAEAEPPGRAEAVMEPGPSTIRPNTRAEALVERLARRQLKTAVVTTPEGVLLGVFHREEPGS